MYTVYMYIISHIFRRVGAALLQGKFTEAVDLIMSGGTGAGGAVTGETSVGVSLHISAADLPHMCVLCCARSLGGSRGDNVARAQRFQRIPSCLDLITHFQYHCCITSFNPTSHTTTATFTIPTQHPRPGRVRRGQGRASKAATKPLKNTANAPSPCRERNENKNDGGIGAPQPSSASTTCYPANLHPCNAYDQLPTTHYITCSANAAKQEEGKGTDGAAAPQPAVQEQKYGVEEGRAAWLEQRDPRVSCYSVARRELWCNLFRMWWWV